MFLLLDFHCLIFIFYFYEVQHYVNDDLADLHVQSVEFVSATAKPQIIRGLFDLEETHSIALTASVLGGGARTVPRGRALLRTSHYLIDADFFAYNASYEHLFRLDAYVASDENQIIQSRTEKKKTITTIIILIILNIFL